MLIFTLIFIGLLLPITICLPGYFIYRSFILKTRAKPELIELILISFSVGCLYNFYQFIMGMLLLLTNKINHISLVYFKYFFDFILVLYLFKNKPKLFSFKFNLQKKDFLLIIFSIFIGFLAILNFPYVFQGKQIFWLTKFLDLEIGQFNFKTLLSIFNEGAFGYSALIYFPKVIFYKLPIETIASTLKVSYSAILVLTTIYILNKENKNNFILNLLFYTIILFSRMGFYGGLIQAKATFFAALFCILYLFSLLNTSRDKLIKLDLSCLFFAVAICFKIAILPYLLIISTLWFIFYGHNINLITFSTKLVLYSFIPLIINLCLGLKFLTYSASEITYSGLTNIFINNKSFLLISLLTIILLFYYFIYLLFLKHRFTNFIKIINKKIFLDKNNTLLFFIIIFVIGYFIKTIIPGNNLAGLFRDRSLNIYYYFLQESHLPKLIFLLYFLAVIENIKQINSPRIQIAAFFPFIAIIIFFLSYSFKIFSIFNFDEIETFIRDIPRYFIPFIAVYFSILFIDKKLKIFSRFNSCLIYIGLIIYFLCSNIYLIQDLANWAHFTELNGHKNLYFAYSFRDLHKYYKKGYYVLFSINSNVFNDLFKYDHSFIINSQKRENTYRIRIYKEPLYYNLASKGNLYEIYFITKDYANIYYKDERNYFMIPLNNINSYLPALMISDIGMIKKIKTVYPFLNISQLENYNNLCQGESLFLLNNK